jgi:hypothetical protein
MERFTAYLEVTAYSWLTFLAVALGGVMALLTIRAEARRYPAIFRRRRSLTILLLLLLSALSIPLAIFVPGPASFPMFSAAGFFVLPVALVSAVLFRFVRVGAPTVIILLGLLIWSEHVATRGFLFPRGGEPIAFIDVREVTEERVDLFAEFPFGAGRRLLEPGVDYSFPISLRAGVFSLTGETVTVHPYLWWRVPSVGLRIRGFDGASEGAEPFAVLSGGSETALGLLDRVSLLHRDNWQSTIPAEELLLARYELVLRDGEPVLARSRHQAE